MSKGLSGVSRGRPKPRTKNTERTTEEIGDALESFVEHATVTPPPAKKRLNMLIDGELHTDVKVRAAKEGRTVTALVEEVLRAYLAREVDE